MNHYTWSEIRAAKLLQYPFTTEPINYHEAGNRIIELAEQIKSDRAIAAMVR